MSNASIKEKITKVPPLVVFLGAGASYPLGYPITRTFVDNFRTSLEQNGKTDEAFFLHSILNRINPDMDIEQVLELIEALEDSFYNHPTEPFFRTHDTRINIGGNNWDLSTIKRVTKSLREETEKEVFEAYRWRPDILGDARKLYEPLLNTLNDKVEDKQIFIFTTNYDRVIEKVGSALREFDVIDGFKLVKGGEYLWDPLEEFAKEPKNMSLIKLFKLHGSLNWRERTDGKFERVSTEERTLGNQTYKRNVVIYPTLTHKTNHYTEYHKELYELFKESMQMGFGTLLCFDGYPGNY